MKLLVLFLLVVTLQAKELEKVSLQLLWLNQFQFAGYYMAKEKGFYEEAGLDVSFHPFTEETNVVDDVVQGRANYGIGRSSLIIKHSDGVPIKLLAAIFQSSPLVLLTREDSGIKSIEDFKYKRIMTTDDAFVVASIVSMMHKNHVNLDSLVQQKSSFNIYDLINKKTDIFASYLSNEPYTLQKEHVKYRVFNPKDYGFNFYSDLLFTSTNEATQHKERTQKFKGASLKGWKYAFAHIDETVSIILQKYNTQHKSKAALRFEADVLKKLAYEDTDKVGVVKLSRLQRIFDIYNIFGLAKNKIHLEGILFNPPKEQKIAFSLRQKEYLNIKNDIKICVVPNMLPYSKISDGKYIGMSADYMQIISKKLDKAFTLVPTKTIEESIKNVLVGKCEVLTALHTGYDIKGDVSYSDVFYKSTVVVVTRNSEQYLTELSTLEGKKIAVIKGYFYIKTLKKEYPTIEIVTVKDTLEGLAKVASSDTYAFLGDLESSIYNVQRNYTHELRVNGTLKKKGDIAMLVSTRDPQLLGIINKAISSVSEKQKELIRKEWLNKTYLKVVDYTLVWVILTVGLFIFILVLFFIRKQAKLQSKIEEMNKTLQHRVEDQTYEIIESARRFESIFNLVQDGIAIIDRDSNFLLVNNAYTAMTAYTKEELYKTSCVALTPQEMQEKSQSVMQEVVSKGYYNNYEKQCVGKDGNIIDVMMNLILMPNKKTLLLVVKDITLVKIQEKEKELQERQLFQHSKLIQMGEMISMIAHQWRQPLGALSSTAIDLKLKIELDVFDIDTAQGREKAKEYFIKKTTYIESLIQTLTSTIDDFRDFYKPSKNSEMSTIEKPIRKALEIIENSLTVDEIRLDLSLNSNKNIRLYNSEFMQVMLNIIKNAQDNFHLVKVEEPFISIDVQDTQKGVTIRVCDNGGGISEDIIDNIFNPYFSTKEEKNGTGIGLYMSKMIVEEHHDGILFVENSDLGSCFTIELKSSDQ